MDIGERYVGYVRSMHSNRDLANWACAFQKARINKFCNTSGIACIDIFEDYGYKDDCRRKEKGLAKELGIKELENMYIPDGWGKLLYMIVNHKVDFIIVDTKIRLWKNELEERITTQVCSQNGVRIIEVPSNMDGEGTSGRVFIYHCTNSPSKRYGVVMNDIDEMYEYAASLDGDVSGLYIDMEFKERVQLENAIRSVGDNDTLVVKNYLHLKRFTGASFAVFKDIEDNGGKIISQEEGRIKSVDKDMIQELRDSSINVAYYDGQLHKYDKDNAELDLQKVKAYIRCCTNGWKLTNDDIYIDEYGFSKQRRLEELIENQDRYGLIIVNSYPRLNKDISRFMKIVKRIHIPIYSMREEF